jgi:hypothetical protein
MDAANRPVRGKNRHLHREATTMHRMILCLFLGISFCVPSWGQVRPVATAENSNEQYHVILWACQREDDAPRFTHTWATFIKSRKADSSEADPKLDERFTISWMPASGVIPVLVTVRGQNYTLRQSLNWARQEHCRVSAWGPIAIRKELYDLAKQRKAVLESGVLSYKMIDNPVRPNKGTNCIHAITDMVPGELLDTGTARGEEATRMVAEFLQPFMIRPEYNDPKVFELVDVSWDTVEHRTLEAAAPNP